MNINNYINRTKRKTKKEKLPALSTLSPIMPDGGAGIDSFNNSSGGAMMESFDGENKLVRELFDAATMFLVAEGYDEDMAESSIDCDLTEEGAQTMLVMSTPLTSNSILRELADTLNPILNSYDSEAYFDETVHGELIAYLQNDMSIEESLKRLDSSGFDMYSEDYNLQLVYEDMNKSLTSKQKSDLKKFIDKSNDPEEVDIYMKGLLSEAVDDDEDLDFDFEEEPIDEDPTETDKTLDDIIKDIEDNIPKKDNWKVADNGKHEKTNAIDFIVSGDHKYDHLAFDYWMKNESEEFTGFIAEKYLDKNLDEDTSGEYKGIHGYRFRKDTMSNDDFDFSEDDLAEEEPFEDNLDFEDDDFDLNSEEDNLDFEEDEEEIN